MHIVVLYCPQEYYATFLMESLVTMQVIPSVATHFSVVWSVLSVCHLSHSCTCLMDVDAISQVQL